MSHKNINSADESVVQSDTVENTQDDQLQSCQNQLAQAKDQHMRAVADLQNYIKRSEKDRTLFEQSVYDRICGDLLPIIDDFDRARAEFDHEKLDKKIQTWMQGFELISKQLEKILGRYGVHKIEQLTTFDPTIHEALARVASDDHASGDIVEVMQAGYMIGDRVLRPAKVTVAQ